MVSIQYVGNRSYVEYTSKIDGVRYGWTRQRIQHNIPADLVEMFKKDTSKIWVVLDDKPVAQAKEMAKAIEEPVVEEVVVEEPAAEALMNPATEDSSEGEQ